MRSCFHTVPIKITVQNKMHLFKYDNTFWNVIMYELFAEYVFASLSEIWSNLGNEANTCELMI